MKCKHGHTIDEDHQVVIKMVRGNPYRYCKTCLSISNKKYKAKRKEALEVAKVEKTGPVFWVEAKVAMRRYPAMSGATLESSLDLAAKWAVKFKVPYVVYTELMPDGHGGILAWGEDPK